MITDDEVLRLFERADPAQTDDAAPAIDAAAYLATLRTRSSTVDYIDTEPTPTEPPTNRHRWLGAAAAAATVAVIVGGLVLAARDDDESGGASDAAEPGPFPVDTGPVTEHSPVTEQPVTTPPAGATTPAVEDAGTRVGFVGLPPEGATPSTPEGGELVVWIWACGTPAAQDGLFSDPSEIDTWPPLGKLLVLADGRLIWQKYEDLPEGANRLSTGLLEQRLTPEGVELMRSEAAGFAGEPLHCLPGSHEMLFAPAAATDGAPPRGKPSALTTSTTRGSWIRGRGCRQPPGRTARSGPMCQPSTWSRSSQRIQSVSKRTSSPNSYRQRRPISSPPSRVTGRDTT